MADEELLDDARTATANAVAMTTAMQTEDPLLIEREIRAAIEWTGLDPTSAEGKKVGVQLSQSTYVATLAIDLLSESLGIPRAVAGQRLAALIAAFDLD